MGVAVAVELGPAEVDPGSDLRYGSMLISTGPGTVGVVDGGCVVVVGGGVVFGGEGATAGGASPVGTVVVTVTTRASGGESDAPPHPARATTVNATSSRFVSRD